MDETLWGAVNERDGGSPLIELWVSGEVVWVVESGLFGRGGECCDGGRGHAMKL